MLKTEIDPAKNPLEVQKVVIWGHKLYSHTHSFAHYGYYKAFKNLGYETYWFDNKDDVSKFDFRNSLFITEGQVDARIPLRKDCYYVLHNVHLEKYHENLEKENYIILQVYTHDIVNDGRQYEIVPDAKYHYFTPADRTLYMPWATLLIPDEIEKNKRTIRDVRKKNFVGFVGLLWGGKFGNLDTMTPFIKACKDHGVKFKRPFRSAHGNKYPVKSAIKFIQSALFAPAIQGGWQCEKGYITSKIFENISYGQFGVTNNPTVNELFEGKIVFNPDSYHLFTDAKNYADNLNWDEIYAQMDVVKEQHTYFNRIQKLFWFFNTINEY
jgi:hypothetical protein